jgi:hypothetical protein
MKKEQVDKNMDSGRENETFLSLQVNLDNQFWDMEFVENLILPYIVNEGKTRLI